MAKRNIWAVLDRGDVVSVHRNPHTAAVAIVEAGKQGDWKIGLVRASGGFWLLSARQTREEIAMAEVSHGAQGTLDA